MQSIICLCITAYSVAASDTPHEQSGDQRMVNLAETIFSIVGLVCLCGFTCYGFCNRSTAQNDAPPTFASSFGRPHPMTNVTPRTETGSLEESWLEHP